MVDNRRADRDGVQGVWADRANGNVLLFQWLARGWQGADGVMRQHGFEPDGGLEPGAESPLTLGVISLATPPSEP